MMFFQKFLASHLSWEKIDHRRWEKNPWHRNEIYKIEILWKEENSYEYEWSTGNQCESSECWEDEVYNEEITPELYEKSLKWFCSEKWRIIEIVSKYRDKHENP